MAQNDSYVDNTFPGLENVLEEGETIKLKDAIALYGGRCVQIQGDGNGEHTNKNRSPTILSLHLSWVQRATYFRDHTLA